MKLLTSIGLISFVVACGSLLAAHPANAGKVTIKNCTSERYIFATFNDTDQLLAIPFNEKTLSPGQSSTLSCLGRGCKISVRKNNTSSQRFYRSAYSGNVYLDVSMRMFTEGNLPTALGANGQRVKIYPC